MYSLIRVTLLLLLFISCKEAEKACVCTFEYTPVCSNGIQFDNKCLAKCNGASPIVTGKCECNSKSGEVCATPPMPLCPEGMMCTQVIPQPRIYGNECEALKDKATILNHKNCN